jgi:uncharacterized protein (TIGR00299 family) protein
MILGALVDAGLSIDGLRDSLRKLNAKGYEISSMKACRGGINGTLVSVDQDSIGRKRRGAADFIDVIRSSNLSESVVEKSLKIFKNLADAEARVHGTPVEQVTLHELGEVDTLVDVVGSVLGLEMLGVDEVFCSALAAGSGFVKTEHGYLSVPTPATLALFEMAKAPVSPTPGGIPDTGEMTTPTGAAILTTLATFERPNMTVSKTGYGLGSRNPDEYPNAIRICLGESNDGHPRDNLLILETNIDDMSGEILGYLQERLFELGAKDVWFTPIQMKKNRPATMVSAIVSIECEKSATSLILKETSTLGVRLRPFSRYEADREEVQFNSTLGHTRIKLKILQGQRISTSPEYEDCKVIALNLGIPLQQVLRRIQQEADDQLLN